jgi:hypothetical protein
LLDLGEKKWVKNRKNLQKFAFFSKNVQKCALFDPVFCTPLRKLFEVENSHLVFRMSPEQSGVAGFGVGNFFVIILLQTPARLMRNRGF